MARSAFHGGSETSEESRPSSPSPQLDEPPLARNPLDLTVRPVSRMSHTRPYHDSLPSSPRSLGAFSLDLDKLPEGSEDNKSTTSSIDDPAMRERKPSMSSHVDGPSDFTLNLEQWMRGTITENDEVGKADDKSNPKGGLDGHEHNTKYDDSEFEPLSSSTPGPQRKTEPEPPAEQARISSQESKQTDTVSSTAVGSLEAEIAGTNRTTGALSNGEDDATTARLADLEAQVQNYRDTLEQADEELRTYQIETGGLQRDNEAKDFDIIELRSKIDFEEMAHREELKLKDEQLEDLQKQLQDTRRQASDEALNLKEEIRKLTQKAEERDLLISRQQSLEKELREARQDKEKANGEKEAAKSHVAELQSLRSEIEWMRKDRDSQVMDLQDKVEEITEKSASEMNTLRDDYEKSQSDMEKRLGELLDLVEQFQDERDSLKSQLESQKNMHDTEKMILQSDLNSSKAETLRLKSELAGLEHDHTVQIRTLRAELENVQQNSEEDKALLETFTSNTDSLHATVTRQTQDIGSYEAALNIAKAEARELASLLEKSEQEVEKLRVQVAKAAQLETGKSEDNGAEVEKLKQTHDKQIEHLKSSHESEVKRLKDTLLKVGDGMRKREDRMLKEHDEWKAKLEQQIASLKSDQQKTAAWKQEKEKLERQVLRLNQIVSTLSTQLRGAKEDMKTVKEDNEEINAQLEARFTQSMNAREKEWRRRVEFVLKERDRMAKALMAAWGKEEMGPGEPQPFRYRYVKRA